MPIARAALRAWHFHVLAVLAGAIATCAQAAPQSVEWQVTLDGATVGRASWRWSEQEGAESYEESLRINVQQAGQRAQLGYRYSFARRPGTDTFTFSREIELGETKQFDRGRIEAGKLHIDASSLRESHLDLPLPAGAVMPYERTRRMHAESASHARSTAVQWFDLDMLQVIPASLSKCKPTPESAPTPHCARISLAKIGAQPERWQYDANGALQSVEQNFAHMPLLLQRCDGRCPASVKSLDLLGRLVLDSPLKLQAAAMQSTIRYVVSRSDGQPPHFAATNDQRLDLEGGRGVLTVCRGCYERSAPTAEQLEVARQSTPWLQSADPLYRRMAVRVGGRNNSVDSRMRRSVFLVSETLKPVRSFIGYADAVQTLKLGKADCVGYAVALATLARAQGIPARIVIGIAYTDRFSGRPQAFSPHAWAQAWDGERWASYDASLGEFDSTHIALATGNGDPEDLRTVYSQLRLLKIERVEVLEPGQR